MYRNHTVAVVVPARNEAEFVGGVVDAIPAFVDRVYVVDDASTDATRTVALDAADPDRGSPPESGFDDNAVDDRVAERTRRGRVLVLRHDECRGPGGAVKTGYLAALAERADLVATLDADGQMNPATLDSFLDPLVDGDADYAKGTRLERREDTAEMPAVRLFGNVALTLLCRLSSGYWELTDPVNGYTAITSVALADIAPSRLYEGYGYGTDVLAKLHVAERRVVDVPHASTYGDEVSGIDYSTYVPRVSRLLAANFAWRLREERGPEPPTPAAFAGSAGASVGVLAGAARGVLDAVGRAVLERGGEQ